MPIQASCIILGLGKAFLKQILQKPASNAIILFMKNLPRCWLQKQEEFVCRIMKTLFHSPMPCMRLIPPLLIYAWTFLAGLLFANIRAQLNSIHNMMCGLQFLYLSMLQPHDVNAMDNISYEPGSFYIFDIKQQLQ